MLSELAERIDAEALVQLAPLVRLPDVQRLGYLLDAIGQGGLAGPLAEWLKGQRPRAVPLGSGSPTAARADKRWHVMPNEVLEADI